jgi:putative sigma-54 modulation protein
MIANHQYFSDAIVIIFELLDVLRPPRIASESPPDERTGDSSMRIDIQARGFNLTEGLRAQAERRVRFALGSASGRVRSVVMRLADENGPRGGEDKRCTIRANLPGGPPVVIEHQEADLYVAIDRAAGRAARAVSRRLGKTAAGRRDATVTANGSLDTESLSR